MKLVCDCGEIIYLTEEDEDFCEIECPACCSTISYEI